MYCWREGRKGICVGKSIPTVCQNIPSLKLPLKVAKPKMQFASLLEKYIHIDAYL